MKKSFLFFIILTMGFSVAKAQTSANLVDFEYINGHVPVEGDPIDNVYFSDNYCIQFYHDSLGSPDVPMYAEVGGSNYAFVNSYSSYSTTKGVSCNGTFGSYDIPNSAGVDEGCFFLCDDVAGANINPKALVIDYEDCISCDSASGYIIDLDGTDTLQEGWQIDAYVNGSTVIDQTIYVLSDDWNLCTSCPSVTPFNGGVNNTAADATAKYWEINTSGPIDYLVFTYIGNPARGAGFAMDEFYYCTANEEPEPDPCEVQALFEYEIDNCKATFYDYSYSGSTTTIVNYHWEFGDGATSNEASPVHFYDLAGVYEVCLTVTAYNGEECCTSTYCTEIVIDQECEEVCEGEVSFTYTESECGDCSYTFSPSVIGNTVPVLAYYWDFGDGTISTEENPTHTVTSGQVCLTVILDIEDECCTLSYCENIECDGEVSPELKTINDNGTGNSKQEDKSDLDLNTNQTLNIYPNPSSQSEINIEMKNDVEGTVEYQVYNINGNQVDKGYLQNAGGNLFNLSVNELPNGVYILKTSSNGTVNNGMFQIAR